MPIKPENKARYPKDWKDVRHRILQRANWRCEHQGCRARHGVTGYWRKGLFHRLPDVLWDAGYTAGDMVACENGEKLKVIKIVLTIAHLDHTPENNGEAGYRPNLKAWCQYHHLAYDRAHHLANGRKTRDAKKGQESMPIFSTPSLEAPA